MKIRRAKLELKNEIKKTKECTSRCQVYCGPRGKTNKNPRLYELDLDLCWVSAIAQVDSVE